jgi:hypothetical protein
MNSSEGLALVERPDAAQALMPVLSVEQAVARYEAVVKFVKSLMQEGHDFGTIQGTDKPSLWKPGAEKLTTFFGLSKRFYLAEKIEDWSGADHGGEAFFYYSYRCALYNGDSLIAESDGSCNSFESRYRWRKAERVCPTCGVAAIIKGKEEYGGGWICFKKKDGCGAKFPNGSSEDLVVDAFDGEDRSPAHTQRKATNQPSRPAAQSTQSNGKSPEEKALDEALLAHCVKQKGDKTGKVYFDNVYLKKSLDEKREAARSLGLAVAAPAAPPAPAPQPVTPPAQDVVEGELIETTSSPARDEIEQLVAGLQRVGCSPDHINSKIAKIAGGHYALDEIAEADLPKVKLMLSRYVDMGDQAAAEIAKEFKPKEGK